MGTLSRTIFRSVQIILDIALKICYNILIEKIWEWAKQKELKWTIILHN